jgi:dihydroxyacetone kinase-like protein
MHFRQAAKIARAEGTRVASVLVADDLGTEGSGSLIGRRGTGGTLFVEKIAGARAREGADLADVEAVARRVAEASVSFGVALSPCSMPGAPPMARLGPAEIDVGVGIHGEAGRREPLRAAHELVGDIIEVLLTSLQAPPDARLLALVSGLGGTPLIEQQLIFAELATQLQDRGMCIERSLVGPYVTSLEMAGVLISLLEIDDELTALWDAPVHTPALRWRM